MTRREADPESGATGGERAPKCDLLLEAVRRSDLLAELRSAPADASDLEDALDISRSTIHRATKSLTGLDLIEKSGGRYELTGFGEIVADETCTFRRRIEAAASLGPFLNTVEMDRIPVEHFADAEIIRPNPRQPHCSVRRIIELIERSGTLRVFSTVLSPFYVDVTHREMLNGMETEAIFDEQIIDILLVDYEQEAIEAVETGRFDVRAHADLPFELFLFDDRIGMAAHDENGIARLFVESDDDEAIEWAVQLYERYRDESRPVPEFEDR